MAALATVRQINTVGQPAAGTGLLSEALEWAQDTLKGAFGGVLKKRAESCDGPVRIYLVTVKELSKE